MGNGVTGEEMTITVLFHFAFLKNYGTSHYDRIDLPTWMNGKIIEVLESELEKAKNEFDNLK